MVNNHVSDRWHRGLAVGLLALVLLAGYGLIARPMIMKYRDYRANIAQLQDRLQRLEGMLATRRSLEEQIQQVRQSGVIGHNYLGQSSPTLAATDLQQRVKDIVESNGGSLVSTQILPVTQEDNFSRVTIRVIMTGDTEILQKLSYALESARPLLFVENLQIRAQQTRRFNNRNDPGDTQIQLSIQFDLSGYMLGEY